MTHRAPDKECSGWETNYLTMVLVGFEHVNRTYTYNVDVDVRTYGQRPFRQMSLGPVARWPGGQLANDRSTDARRTGSGTHGHVNLETGKWLKVLQSGTATYICGTWKVDVVPDQCFFPGNNFWLGNPPKVKRWISDKVKPVSSDFWHLGFCFSFSSFIALKSSAC